MSEGTVTDQPYGSVSVNAPYPPNCIKMGDFDADWLWLERSTCDVCGANNVATLAVNSSGDEYSAKHICQTCITSLFVHAHYLPKFR